MANRLQGTRVSSALRARAWVWLLVILLLATACSPASQEAAPAEEPVATGGTTAEEELHQDEAEDEHSDEAELEMLVLPELAAADLGGRPLRVLATTSIIGDVVARVGGEAIELTTLMGPGVDPHSYQPGAADLTAAAQADVILVNGWDLEEGLIDDLANIGGDTPLVPVNAGVDPLPFGGKHDEEHEKEEAHEEEEEAHEGEEDEHGHGAVDPHTWFAVPNVRQWSDTIASALSMLDPANAETFTANAATYQSELDTLEAELTEQVATIPQEARVLVTNHDSLGYLAEAYGFEVLGTILPSASTVAEPTASELAQLIEVMQREGVCTVFTETTVSDRLGQTVAAELDACDNVQVLPLYTGALGPEGSGAESYTGMMRANFATLVQGLR